MSRKPKKFSLTAKIFFAMLLGACTGLAINLSGLNAPTSWVHTYLIDGLFSVVGTIFINALKMLVVPLVLLSLISGVVGIGDIKRLGSIGTKSFALYLLTTSLAVSAALFVAFIADIGTGLHLQSDSLFETKQAPPLTQVIIDIVPNNIFEAFVSGNMLQVIFVSIVIGIAILMVGSKAKPLVELIEIADEVMMKTVMIVMAFAPMGVFALIGRAVAGLGTDLFVHLASYVLVLIGVLLLHLFVTLTGVLYLFSKKNPLLFLRKIRTVQLFAFSTSSSSATIPVTLRTVIERLGVHPSVASFTVPFGATINMDGTAMMQGVATVFIANAYGIDLEATQYLTVVAMSVLASVGTAGVPGVGLIMLSMVFTQVGLPVEGIGLILGVDRLLDMIRSSVNVTGDAAVSVIVAKSEGKLDEKTYDDPHAGSVRKEELHIDKKAERELAKTLNR